MKNYRVLLDKKKNIYFVQGQSMFKKWLPITEDGDILFKTKTYLYFVAYFGAILLNYFVDVKPTVLGVVAILYDFFFIIYGIFWLTEMKDKFKPRYFHSEGSAKEYINEKVSEEEYDEHLKKVGKTKVVGVMIDGEYVDGKQLERWKKLERIVNEEKIISK